jgi:YegS/Rv2252/BmrU family lipid kinase
MTAQEVVTQQSRAFVILNPVAGRTTPDDVRNALDASLGQDGWVFDIYETKPDDDLRKRIRDAVSGGCDIVIAAGGDGTVSMVASSLVGTSVPLGVIPAGSANVLALELGIPGDIPTAANLLIAEHQVRELDVMQMGEQYFILQIGIGLDSLMIKDTDREAKRAYGRWAYMSTLAKKLFGFEAQRFTIVVDGKRLRPRAAQVLVANAGTLGAPPFRWGPNIFPSDGELDLCIVKVRTLTDYPRLAWQIVTGRYKSGQNIEYVRIRRTVTIASDRPLPVQADGEIIGNTPVQVDVVPKGIKIIVPVDPDTASPLDIAREAGKKS